MLLMSSIHEMYLITNRYFVLKGKANWISNIKLKYYINYVPFLIIVPIALLCPTVLVISIRRKEVNSELFYWEVTEIGQTNYIRAYFLILIFIKNIIPLIVLVTMTIICQNEFKKRFQIKNYPSVVKEFQKTRK